MKNGLVIKTGLLKYICECGNFSIVKMWCNTHNGIANTFGFDDGMDLHLSAYKIKYVKWMESPYNLQHIHWRSSSECDKIYLNEMHFLYWPLNEQRTAFAS